MGCGASQLNLDTAPTTDDATLTAIATKAAAKAAKLRRVDPEWPAWKGNNAWNRTAPWKKGGGSSLEPLLRADPELGGSPIALLDARLLVALAEQGGILRRRQDLPAEAFLDLPTLQKMPGKGTISASSASRTRGSSLTTRTRTQYRCARSRGSSRSTSNHMRPPAR